MSITVNILYSGKEGNAKAFASRNDKSEESSTAFVRKKEMNVMSILFL